MPFKAADPRILLSNWNWAAMRAILTSAVPAEHAALVELLLGKRKWRAGAAHKVLHFLLGNEAILVGIHRLEDAFVSSLKLL
jgi:hypothetical protein